MNPFTNLVILGLAALLFYVFELPWLAVTIMGLRTAWWIFYEIMQHREKKRYESESTSEDQISNSSFTLQSHENAKIAEDADESLHNYSDQSTALFCTSCGTPRSGEGFFCIECGASFSG